jgi:hypothetical protein
MIHCLCLSVRWLCIEWTRVDVRTKLRTYGFSFLKTASGIFAFLKAPGTRVAITLCNKLPRFEMLSDEGLLITLSRRHACFASRIGNVNSKTAPRGDFVVSIGADQHQVPHIRAG